MRREIDPDIYCPQAALVDEETARRTERRLARYRAKYEAQKQHEKNMALQQQRQQRMLVAGGALVAVAALSLIWYRKYSTKGIRRGRQQKRGGGTEGDLPRDLFLEEDDGFDGTDEELQQVFDEAAKVARKFPDGTLDQRDQLMLYGLYKQATLGDRNDDDAPSKINVVAYAKYDAWGKFKGLPKQFAMKNYCEVVYHFSTGGDSSFSNGGKGGREDNADVVYDDDKQQGDVDEDGCPVDQSEIADDFGGSMTGMGMGIRPSTLSGSDHLENNKFEGTDSSLEVCLRNAAIKNDVDLLQESIRGSCDGARSCDIDNADENGLGALHLAADRGSIDCLKILVETGANVNAVDCDSISVLQTALIAGLDVESLRILLEAGADPDHCDDDGESPRMWVAEEGDDDVVELFALFP